MPRQICFAVDFCHCTDSFCHECHGQQMSHACNDPGIRRLLFLKRTFLGSVEILIQNWKRITFFILWKVKIKNYSFVGCFIRVCVVSLTWTLCFRCWPQWSIWFYTASVSTTPSTSTTPSSRSCSRSTSYQSKSFHHCQYLLWNRFTYFV